VRVAALTCALFTAACTAESGPPDLGACADEPEAGQTYGEIGIGSCLSGPVDLQFVEIGGDSFLAVSNADPFRNYSGGSVLLIDWNDTVGRFDDEILLTHEIDAIPVRTEHFVSGLGWYTGASEDEDVNRLFITRRLSLLDNGDPDRTRSANDDVQVLNLDTLETDQILTVKDDPGAVAVASDGTTYVLNYTDHSVSVIDNGLLDGEPTAIVRDLSFGAEIEPFGLDDADNSGSIAELANLSLFDEPEVPDEVWELTWIPGVTRYWVFEGDTTPQRYDSGGGPPIASGLGNDFTSTAPDEVARDAFVVPVTLENIESSLPFTVGVGSDFDLTMLYSDGRGIRRLSSTGGLADGAQILTNGGPSGAFDELHGGPSLAIAGGDVTLYYDAAFANDPERAVISFASASDALTFSTSGEVLLDPADFGFESFEQPYVQLDDRTGTSRMWLSMFDGSRYVVGYSESTDGLTWSAPVVVEDRFYDTAAPVVRFVNGEYVMVVARRSGPAVEAWQFVELQSDDGIVWDSPRVLFDAAPRPDALFDARQPPRAAVAVTPSNTWRVEGIDEGNTGLPAVPGFVYRDISNGFEFTVVAGHEVENNVVPDNQAVNGIVPGSHYDLGGIDRLYVTVTGDDERQRLALLEAIGRNWDTLEVDLIPSNTGGNVAGVYSPAVHRFDDGFVMFYAALDGNGVSTIRAATSPDGRSWTPAGPLFDSPDALGDWASFAQEPRSVEVLEDGSVRVWLSGNDGSRFRVGAILATDFDPATPNVGFALEPGPLGTPYHITPGVPGSVDDSGVRDPMVVTGADGTAVMYYSAFDGERWQLAFAERVGDTWVPRATPNADETLSAMGGIPRTFSAGGVISPVASANPDGTFRMFYAGLDFADNGTPRLGRAIGRAPVAFASQRGPTLGDQLSFVTRRGTEEDDVIELAQNVEAFLTTGIGTTGLVLDENRGFLYVPSKLSNLLYVVDIRDDSAVGAPDYNALDLETLVRLPTISGNNGYRGGVISPSGDRLYLTTRNPESVVVLDLDAIEDNGIKEVTEEPTVGSLPIQDTLFDAGADSVASIGGGHPAIATVSTGLSTRELLIVPHFRDNSVSIFDLGLGAYGAEIAYLPHIGENPHRVRVSPDGRWAIVANYLGDVTDERSSSTLAIIDLNPESQTFLQVTNWIKNRP
jgi:hypothetical protein